MGSFSIWHWLIVGIVLLLLFGKGRFSEMMGDVAKGIKAFKKGMTEEETPTTTTTTPPTAVEPVRTIEHQPSTVKAPEPAATVAGPLGERKVG